MKRRKSRTIYKRGSRYYGDFRSFGLDGGRMEALMLPGTNRAVQDRAEAERLYDIRLAELLSERIKRNPLPDPEFGDGVVTLRRVLDQHIAKYRTIYDPRVTRDHERYREIILDILPPSVAIVDLRPQHIQNALIYLKDEYRGVQGKPMAGSTRLHILGFLQRALDEGVYSGLITSNPARAIPPMLRPSSLHSETSFYSVEQAGQILAALARNPDGSRPADWPANIPDYVLEQVAFALLTGARRNEIQAQRWEWIDWANNRIRIYTSKKLRGEDRGRLVREVVRSVPLWPQLREIIGALWQRRGRPASGLMFPKLRAPTRVRVHAASMIERGGFVDKAVLTILRLRGLVGGREGRDPALIQWIFRI